MNSKWPFYWYIWTFGGCCSIFRDQQKNKLFLISFNLPHNNIYQVVSKYLHISVFSANIRINKLIQNLAPNYSSTGYIRGNFVKLTFGDYLVNVPGIINGFSINPIFDAGFDIGGTKEEITENITSGYQLPKAIKISGFGFTPIASNGNRLVSSDSKFIGGEIDNPF